MGDNVVFFSNDNEFYSFKMTTTEFEKILKQIIPIHAGLPFTEYSELCDQYYISQFWNCFTCDKPIAEVLYISPFLDKMLVHGYNFSQFKTNKLENAKRLQLKRKNGEGFTPAVGWCDTIKMCANTEKPRITRVCNKHKCFLKIYVHVMSGDICIQKIVEVLH
jgi:hypothetical protein